MEISGTVSFGDVVNKFENMPFLEKLKTVKQLYQFTNGNHFGTMKWDGCLCRDENECVHLSGGECYVYIWKHNFGEPFYVGSGKKDRWKTINPRCDKFYEHLDKADTIVYKVVDGISRNKAFDYERYVSYCLSLTGYELVNNDNNYAKASEQTRYNVDKTLSVLEKDENKLSIENAVLKILNDNKLNECRSTMTFLKEYGENYFSKKYKNG